MSYKVLFALSLLGSLCATGCGGGGASATQPTQPVQPPPAATIAMAAGNVNNLQLCGGANYTFAATASNGSAITWSVDNTMLATINASTGVATPNCSTNGSLNIVATSATDSTLTAKWPVNVVNQIAYNLSGTAGTSSADTWVVNSDGTGAKKILSNSCFDPNYFPGHTGFACTANTAAGNQAQMFKTDGTATATPIAMLSFAGVIQVDHVSRSPDGKTVLFTAFDPTAYQSGVYTASATDGSNVKPLSQEAACIGGCIGIGRASYSHDGKKILYEHVITDVQGTHTTLWTMDASGDETSKAQLAPAPWFESANGTFSADDKTVFFDGTPTNSGAAQGIYTVNASGGTPSSAPIPLNSGAFMPVASPDGKKLAYSVKATDGTLSIWTANIDGSGQAEFSTSGGGATW